MSLPRPTPALQPAMAALPTRPEDRCRRALSDIESPCEAHAFWRSEAFAEDLLDAPSEPAARPRPGERPVPSRLRLWALRGLALQPGR
jgi:hypothetical protein